MKYKYVVIGAGAAGLVVAIGLAKAKKKVLLIENNLFGGDCTNYGCIPSKTLIASAKIAHSIKTAKDFGINFKVDNFDATLALKRVKDVIKNIRSHEDEKSLQKLGVDTIKAKASFQSENALKLVFEDGKEDFVEFIKAIIASGSVPMIPQIEGLDITPFDTNETIFSLNEIPKTLAIIGAGAIGCEIGQAFQRLGSKVTLIDFNPRLLAQEDFDASKVLKKIFEKEDLSLYLNSSVNSVKYQNDTFEILIKNSENGYVNQIKSERLLIATGRFLNVSELNLENASISYTKKGILIDSFARTNKKHIFAIGDITGEPFFTHKAESMARSVLFSLLVPILKKKIFLKQMPRVIFTEPEIASIGLTEDQAIKKYSQKKIAVYFVSFDEIDRAICENEKDGFVKIITLKWTSEIIGATIVAKRAGEMIAEILLAMKKHIKLSSISNIVHPYPTYNLAIRKAADKYLTETIFKRKK